MKIRTDKYEKEVNRMEVKVKISGLEDLVSDIEKAKRLIKELEDTLDNIRMNHISTTAELAVIETECVDVFIDSPKRNSTCQ